MTPSPQLASPHPAIGCPLQLPRLHRSLAVQALPSSHEAALLAWTQPLAVSQLSLVQTLPSLQLGAAPPTQVPPAQVSAVVQALPSSHEAALLACTQPLAVSQLSLVQTLPSLQLGAAPPTQVPPAQASAVVHALPSSHETALLACMQPLAVLQLSLVQMLPSLQLGAAPPTQVPPAQVSAVVQALPSSHETALLACMQPLAVLQLSLVQTLPSLQLGAAPPTQVPPAQVSAVVHALPSSHETALLAWTQPVAVLQLSLVQTLPSLQLGAAPPTQVPPAQVSAVVHALPSSQAAVLLTCEQLSPDSLQESLVQTFESEQSRGVPEQVPLLQASLTVQCRPSSQGAVLFRCRHVSAASLQESVVHMFVSAQSREVPEHVPLLQASFTVQYRPSSQVVVVFACRHVSAASLQESFVQAFASPQSRVVPEHVPLLQVSPAVQ